MADGSKMKETPDDEAVRDAAYRVTAGELRGFVERVERLEEEKAGIADQVKEVFAEAKARGYDVAALKRMLKLRKMHADDIAEQEAIDAMYRAALGI